MISINSEEKMPGKGIGVTKTVYKKIVHIVDDIDKLRGKEV